jgi:CheY-like chemotaxis protein/two-component sensor histidine kinase
MINPQPINLNDIIHKIEKLLSRIIGEDIQLHISLADQDLIVLADSTQIEQALMNLATNSRDAMPEGGRLSIKTEAKELTDEFLKAYGYYIKPGEYALLTFEDTGEGMDEKTKEKIFEPFFTTKEIGKGTGLGLSIVYGLVKQHDGYINVYSEPGSGTIFKIYLPLVKLKPEKSIPKDQTTITGGTETILLAEDDIHVRKLMKEVLLGYGYNVLDAVDGEDALKVYKENNEKVQLLILDAIMPKKNGKEVYDEIKTGNPQMKAIFTSGYNSDIIHKKGILQDGLTFIVKPVSPYDLLRKVREVLDTS